MSPISQSGSHQSGSHETGRHEEAGRRGGRHSGGGSPDAPGGLPHHVPGEPPEWTGHHRVVVVVVDGSPESGAALRQAASQARQRNALLDIVCIVADGTAGPASILAKVRLGEFTRRECPHGMGVPVRLRVERGDPQRVLPEVAAGAGRTGRRRSVTSPARRAGTPATRRARLTRGRSPRASTRARRGG